MRRIRRKISQVGVFALYTALVLYLSSNDKHFDDENVPEEDPRWNITKKEINDAIDWAAQYTLSRIGSNGKFVYTEQMNPRVPIPQWQNGSAPFLSLYSVGRHTHSIWGLARYCKLREPCPSAFIDGMVRATYWAYQEFQPTEPGSSLKCIWGSIKLEGGPADFVARNRTSCGIGTTALQLMGSIMLNEWARGTTSEQNITLMADFIADMQMPNGRYYCFMNDQNAIIKGKYDKKNCQYFFGECTLAMLFYYERTKNRKWLDIALLGIKYWVESEDNKEDDSLDEFWFVMASSKLLPHYNKTNKVISEERIRKHVERYLRSAFHNWSTRPYSLTRSYVRIENILSAYHLIPSDIKKDYTRLIKRRVKDVLKMQVKSGFYKGGIPAQKIGLRSTELRIDHNIHAMNGLMEYLRVFFT